MGGGQKGKNRTEAKKRNRRGASEGGELRKEAEKNIAKLQGKGRRKRKAYGKKKQGTADDKIVGG